MPYDNKFISIIKMTERMWALIIAGFMLNVVATFKIKIKSEVRFNDPSSALSLHRKTISISLCDYLLSHILYLPLYGNIIFPASEDIHKHFLWYQSKADAYFS